MTSNGSHMAAAAWAAIDPRFAHSMPYFAVRPPAVPPPAGALKPAVSSASNHSAPSTRTFPALTDDKANAGMPNLSLQGAGTAAAAAAATAAALMTSNALIQQQMHHFYPPPMPSVQQHPSTLPPRLALPPPPVGFIHPPPAAFHVSSSSSPSPAFSGTNIQRKPQVPEAVHQSAAQHSIGQHSTIVHPAAFGAPVGGPPVAQPMSHAVLRPAAPASSGGGLMGPPPPAHVVARSPSLDPPLPPARAPPQAQMREALGPSFNSIRCALIGRVRPSLLCFTPLSSTHFMFHSRQGRD